MTSTVRGVIGTIAVLLPVTVLVFLWASAFFSAWEGHVVSYRPGTGTDQPDDRPPLSQVLIVTEDGDWEERWWPSQVVSGLDIEANASGIPARDIPENAPRTQKRAFSLEFWVFQGEGDPNIVPTTSPRALSIALIVGIVGFLLRNMAVSGSPILLEERDTVLPKSQRAPGAITPSGGARPRKTAPGGKKHRRSRRPR